MHLYQPFFLLQPDKAQGTIHSDFIELTNYLNNNMGPLALIEKLLALKKIGLLFSEMIISNLHSFRFSIEQKQKDVLNVYLKVWNMI